MGASIPLSHEVNPSHFRYLSGIFLSRGNTKMKLMIKGAGSHNRKRTCYLYNLPIPSEPEKSSHFWKFMESRAQNGIKSTEHFKDLT